MGSGLQTSRHEGADIEEFLDREQKRYAAQVDAYAAALGGASRGLYFPFARRLATLVDGRATTGKCRCRIRSTVILMLEQISKSLRSVRWETEFSSVLPKLGISSLSSTEVLQLTDLIRKEFEKGKFGRARNWMALGLFLDQKSFLIEVQRRGLLRCSKYMYHGKNFVWLVDEILQAKNSLSLSEESTRYLESVQAFLPLSKEVGDIYRGLVKKLKKRKGVALKTLVAIVDLLFLKEKQSNRDLPTEDSAFYSQEDMAEALSFLTYLFNRHIGIKDEHFNFVDEKGLIEGLYDQLLVSACKIRQFHEAELMLDAFGYVVTASGSVVKVEAPVATLEKSIRLGYIQTDFQLAIETMRDLLGDLKDVPSLAEFAKHIYDNFGQKVIKYVDHPIPRFVMVFPRAPEVFAPFRSDQLLKEDILYLRRLGKDNYAELETLLNSTLNPALTLFDLLKIQRLINFFRSVMAHSFEPFLLHNVNIVLRSILPVFKKTYLTDLLSECVTPDSAKAFLELTSYGKESEGMFDIQYRPILSGQRSVLVPINILSSSNLLRNLLYTQRKKIRKTTALDPMQHIVARSLLKQKFLVAEGAKIKVDEKTLEIDIAARIDDRLLLIECKSAYHPCGAHEMRTSYEHIETAAEQLDRLRAALHQTARQIDFYRTVNWNVEPTTRIVTCIVTGNRLFNGFALKYHPVRQAYEFINVLLGGTITIVDEEFRVWRGNEFQPQDLFDYIEGSTTIQDFFDSMEDKHLDYQFGTRQMVIRTYALNPRTLLERARAKYCPLGKAKVLREWNQLASSTGNQSDTGP